MNRIWCKDSQLHSGLDPKVLRAGRNVLYELASRTPRKIEMYFQQVRPDTREVVAQDIAQLDALIGG